MPLGTEVDLGPGHIVLDRDPSLPSPKRGTAAPSFRPMSIVAKLSAISATAEHLLHYAVKLDEKNKELYISYCMLSELCRCCLSIVNA